MKKSRLIPSASTVLALTLTIHQVLVHLRAGRWIEAHNLVQSDASPWGAWLHGILHIQEGDLEDAKYWYDRANRHFRSRGSLEEELERFEVALLSKAAPS